MRRRSSRWLLGMRTLVAATLATSVVLAQDREPERRPRVILISLDGAKPDLIEGYLRTGVLEKRTGLGRLMKYGVVAEQNVTAIPSLTAVSHIAIATRFDRCP